jgi:hypothetical protein
MSPGSKFASRSLNSSEYIGELFGPTDNIAVLVRNRGTGKAVQRIAKAEMVVSADLKGIHFRRFVGGPDRAAAGSEHTPAPAAA